MDDKSRTTKDGPCWVTLPWNGWSWCSGTNSVEALAKAEKERKLMIEELEERLQFVKTVTFEISRSEEPSNGW